MTVAKVFRAIARKVKAASTSVAGVIEIATQTEADAGTDTKRAMTPALTARLISAATLALNAAISAIPRPSKATNTDVDAETDDTKYMTVAKVFRAIARKVKAASTSVAGVIEIATTTEADAGTDTKRAMTPALVKRVAEKVNSGVAAVELTKSNVQSGGFRLAASQFEGKNDVFIVFDASGGGLLSDSVFFPKSVILPSVGYDNRRAVAYHHDVDTIAYLEIVLRAVNGVTNNFYEVSFNTPNVTVRFFAL